MSLLPAYMSTVWRVLEQLEREDMHNIDPTLVSTDPLTCHEAVLPFLAWECGVEISNLDEKTARGVIQAGIEAMVHAGSVASLKNQTGALLDNSEVKEWFEYGGEAYHFKVDVTISDMHKRFSEALFDKAKKSITHTKNVRSVLDEIDVHLADAKCGIEIAGAGTLSAKLAQDVSFEYRSSCEIGIGGASAIDVHFTNDFMQEDREVALNLTGGGVMDVKISKTIEVAYPQTDIKLQGAVVWTI